MTKLIHKEELNWKGVLHDLELYESDSVGDLDPVKQVQAVSFIDNNNVVIYKHVDGYYGLPGGSVEENESFEEALKREIREEIACEVLDYGLIGYVRDIPIQPPGKEKYQLRYWAKVRLKDEPINDPCGKALLREVVSLDEALNKLNWGAMGKVLFQLATKNLENKVP